MHATGVPDAQRAGTVKVMGFVQEAGMRSAGVPDAQALV